MKLSSQNNEKREIIQTFCLWADLLGFGQPLKDCNWNLNRESSQKCLDRIERIHYWYDECGFKHKETGLVINDGLAKSIDFCNEITLSQDYIMWFDRTLLIYSLIKKWDIENGYPGVRAIWTTGSRYAYRGNTITADRNVIAHKNTIEKLKKEVTLYSPIPFQMNTAFSKAYIMESGGKSKGFDGPYLFIDIDLLNTFQKFLCCNGHCRDFYSTKMNGNSGEIITDSKPIDYKVELVEFDDYLNWKVIGMTQLGQTKAINLWLEKHPIEYNEQGINTKLYKAIKYEPLDEDDFFDL